jgi:hypothetical protein
MIYKVPTRNEELTLLVTVKTDRPEKICLKVYDSEKKNTVFTDRWKTVNGETTFFVRMPVSGNYALVEIWNDKYGKDVEAKKSGFTVKNVEKTMLEKKVDVVDFSNPLVSSFVNFATRFCYNAGELKSGTYVSENKKFVIEYLPTIQSNQNGKELNTPARISKTTGRIQVSMKQFIPMTVPMRMAILLHEFSHYYINDKMEDEFEADLNGLLIYLGLGYPRIEAHQSFTKTFIGYPSELNKKRYDNINKFIEDFEKNKIIMYE